MVIYFRAASHLGEQYIVAGDVHTMVQIDIYAHVDTILNPNGPLPGVIPAQAGIQREIVLP